MDSKSHGAALDQQSSSDRAENDTDRAPAEAYELQVNDASQPFEGRWNRLVSTTNWEKGRIIFEWREALARAEAPALACSDEAWAMRVGGITAQHVGRLRRVYQRFGQVYSDFQGLYWSHFQAAIDWDDAEMWLEGAIQSKWSVSQMRRTRWETLGSPPQLEPKEEEIVSTELDEDFEPATGREPDARQSRGENSGGPAPEGPDFGDEKQNSHQGASIYAGEIPRDTIDFVRPFENLAELPEDLAEAFEAFKLAILRHKAEQWEAISRDDVLASLEALKELTLAPSAD